jgi:hypothetical protein
MSLQMGGPLQRLNMSSGGSSDATHMTGKSVSEGPYFHSYDCERPYTASWVQLQTCDTAKP